MNFQALGTSGLTALSDCKRYMIARAWSSERWDAWLQMTEGPNVLLAKNLENREAAERFCDEHQRQSAEATHAPS